MRKCSHGDLIMILKMISVLANLGERFYEKYEV